MPPRFLSALLLATAIIASCDAAAQPPDEKRPDKLTVTIGDVRIRIDGPKLWTLSGLDFQDSTIAVQDSAYGSVLHIPAVGILGSAHFLDVPGQPGVVEKEQVSLVRFFLNERPVTDITPTMNLTGKSFRFERESQIRAVRLQSSVALRDGVLREAVRMQTTEAVDLRVTYPLMYAWSPQMSDYLFGDDNGITRRGTFLGEAAKAAEGLEKTARWMAVYDARSQHGAVAVLVRHPAQADAWLQFTDAPGVYRKLRLMSFSDQIMPAGFDGTFEMAVGCFTASRDDWGASALRRLRELRSLAATPANPDTK